MGWDWDWYSDLRQMTDATGDIHVKYAVGCLLSQPTVGDVMDAQNDRAYFVRNVTSDDRNG